MVSRRTGTVAALGGAQTLAWASTYYLPAIIAAPLARELGVSVPTVFAAFSLALLVSACLGPHAGRAIDRWGGRPVLMGTNIVFALGLALLGSAQGPWSMFLAWAVLGVGMGSGLYEAAFAALVRLYGASSRNAITGITLIAGFASTVGWPLTAWLLQDFGWRSACYTWAGLHLVVGLPLNWSLPRAVAHGKQEPGKAAAADSPVPLRSAVLLAFVFAVTWFISTAMAAHLPRLLEATGATLAAAVAVGALIGPAQVGARLLEYGVLRKVHPLLSARLAAALHPLGVVVLWVFGPAAAAVFGILHGAGNGILTIAKGTLPLVLFGPQGYGHRQGVLMVPARIAQALAPWLFGIALDEWGAGALGLSAALGIAAVAALLMLRDDGSVAARREGPAGG
ncbi:MAG: MFS transporter [Comamonadaceae bacterium]|nr:MAG: MFS transporter [Comamonadaceae bacterium]